MRTPIVIGTLACACTLALGDVSDTFESYTVGQPPAGSWLDASEWITNPSNPGPTALVIETTDAGGATTRAVQIQDGIGTSGGIIGRVNYSTVQRFETDLRLDQQGDGSQPNWIAAAGFLQETVQDDFNWMPQAFIYATKNSRRFRLYVRNEDGQSGASQDFGLGVHSWSFDTWYRLSMEVDTSTGIFAVSITDLASGAVLSDVSRTYSGWNQAFGRYDAISVNDGEYGSDPGTIGNMATIDNILHVPAPGALAVVLGGAVLGGCRRRRTA